MATNLTSIVGGNTIGGTTEPHQLSAFLRSLQERAPPSLKVYPLEVFFKDASQRDEHHWEHPEAYGLATNAARDSRASGTLYMVASSPHPIWSLTQAYRSGTWTEEERLAHEQGLVD
ncbi:MAG: hypothetical protein M1816_004961 [Peltula sp. TS41687]|nr:MAG: hypothetical protein M1816_004961 [Peltula sp. TS41687]